MIENTLKIADEVTLSLEKKYHLPGFPLPDPFTDDSEYLVHLAEAGARERYPPRSDGAPAGEDDTLPAQADSLPEEVRKRLDYELGVHP